MSNVPARVAADAAQAEEALRALAAAAAQPPTPPAANDTPPSNEPPAPPPQPPVAPVDTTAELRRAQAAVASLQGRLDQLATQNAVLDGRLQQLAAQPPAPAPAPAPPSPLITEQDRTDYGADMIEFLGRAIAEHLRPLTAQISDLGNRLAGFEGRLGNVGAQVQKVSQVAATTSQDRYLAILDHEIPGWEEVNKDGGFLDFLENVDILTNEKLITLLQAAHNAGRAPAVIDIFRRYKPDMKPASSAPAAPAAPTAPTNPGYIDPNTLAAPSTTPPAPPPAAPPAGRIWTSKEVDEMYADKQKGRLTPAQFQQLEQEYFKALAEGRVVPA